MGIGYKVVCQGCKKIFYLKNKTRAKIAKYCSKNCQHPPIIKICLNPNCETEFRAPERGRQYCCKICSDTSPIKRKKARNSLFETMANPEKRKNWLEGMKNRANNPEWKNSPQFQKGPDHPAYKGNNRKTNEQINRQRYKYAAWRKDVFIRDRFTCQECGLNESGVELHAHHIQEWANYPELRYETDNGKTLCKDCHGRLHDVVFRPKTHICLNPKCRKKFPAKKKSRKFCSLQCSGKYRKGKKKAKEIKCPICNQMFYPRRKTSKFCSNSCSRKSRNNA